MSFWYDRMREIKEENGLSNYQFAKLLDTDTSTISRYEAGRGAESLTRNLKRKLHEVFLESEVRYIEHGGDFPKISMIQSGSNNNQVSGNGNNISSGTIEDSATLHNGKEESITLDYYPESYASAGGGAYSYLVQTKPMSFSKSFLEIHLGLMNYKNIFILNTTGESMEPTLKDGSLIFVNPIENEEDHIRDGGIYVIVCDSTTLVKRVTYNPIAKTYTLISDNPAHENIVVAAISFSEDDCRFVGRVVGSFDRV